jgi:transposase InsO family protein
MGNSSRRAERATRASKWVADTKERASPRSPWRHIDAVEFATLSWVDWFNNRRLLEPLGYVPPAE